MRLINTGTGQLEHFIGRHIPPYAILSHTWTEEEVTFQEFTSQNATIAQKSGFAKIVKTCELAWQDGFKYAWVDTCCIDKTSSAELSEAINSMFQWYKDAAVCYAYLSDFGRREKDDISDSLPPGEAELDALLSCRWFTRGWTLQELIGPRTLRFYDEIWDFRGTKDRYADQIGLVLNIDPMVLRDSGLLTTFSVAEKMTWASGRQTTRVEDAAYCLLGIFDINMPLLYGEGDKAFLRLQQEIIKNNNDLTIFGWSLTSTLVWPVWTLGFGRDCQADCGHQNQYNHTFYGVMAPFLDSFSITRTLHRLDSAEHTVTNRGIKIHCRLLEICLQGCRVFECRCCSNCRGYVLPIGKSGPDSTLGIILSKVGPDTFVRSDARLIHLIKDIHRATSTTLRPIYIMTEAREMPNQLVQNLEIRTERHFQIKSAAPEHRWNSSKRGWYYDNMSEWGIVSLVFLDPGPACRVSVLFCGSWVKILDPTVSRIEIALALQSGASMSWCDVFDLFDNGKLIKTTSSEAVQQIIASVEYEQGTPTAQGPRTLVVCDMWRWRGITEGSAHYRSA